MNKNIKYREPLGPFCDYLIVSFLRGGGGRTFLLPILRWGRIQFNSINSLLDPQKGYSIH